jgi:RHS repeat-associated protein
MTDPSRAVVWDATFRPFGAEDGITGTATDPTSAFPGQYADAASTLYYNWFRDYDPTLGRYIQSDPIGLEGGLISGTACRASWRRSIPPMRAADLPADGDRGGVVHCLYGYR